MFFNACNIARMIILLSKICKRFSFIIESHNYRFAIVLHPAIEVWRNLYRLAISHPDRDECGK